MKFHSATLAGASMLLLGFAIASATTERDICTPGKWFELHKDFHHRSGCIMVDDREVKFEAFSFNLTNHKLGLRGSRPDGGVPSFEDVRMVEETGSSTAFAATGALREEDILLINIGYPEDSRLFTPSGLVRIGGRDLSARDTKASFKSAMFCLNEAKYSRGVGSRVVIFNAFENYRPIILNERVSDSDNCQDVIQVGPRVIEYRAKEGIKPAERRAHGQNYTIFAQGNGAADKDKGYLGYIYKFNDRINLFDIQKFLISANSGNSDLKMRVAIVISTHAYSGLIWRATSGETYQSGITAKPHPVFLTVEPIAN